MLQFQLQPISGTYFTKQLIGDNADNTDLYIAACDASPDCVACQRAVSCGLVLSADDQTIGAILGFSVYYKNEYTSETLNPNASPSAFHHPSASTPVT
jgi:hypothetical protein